MNSDFADPRRLDYRAAFPSCGAATMDPVSHTFGTTPADVLAKVADAFDRIKTQLGTVVADDLGQAAKIGQQIVDAITATEQFLRTAAPAPAPAPADGGNPPAAAAAPAECGPACERLERCKAELTAPRAGVGGPIVDALLRRFAAQAIEAILAAINRRFPSLP